MYKQIKANNEGFTIIEVMIVLAIAALILIIVLLAVPALQRNSKNTTIKNDASTIAGAISDFKSNNNGSTPAGGLQSGSSFNIYGSGSYIGASATVSGGTTVVDATPPATAVANTIYVQFNATCNSGTTLPTAGGTGVAVEYPAQTGSGTIWGGCFST
jgi:prepilin-type N-terminal cleavage/methylation domain-containing protein